MPQLDQQRERVQADLRGLVSGEVRCEDLFLQLFANDGSIYELKPLAVVRPRSTADVAACVQYAAEKKIPVHARGAGTGQAGAALGTGLVIDFSKYLRRIIYTETDKVRVQPGLVLERLNSHLRPLGRMVGPDPANSEVTTLGSMVAVDAAGSRWLQYGSVRQHVLGLQVVLADGQALEVGREPLVDDGQKGAHPRKREIVAQLAQLLQDRADVIRQHQPKVVRNRCGYHLTDVLDATHLDLARLLVGSEGTLALVTEVLLATEAIPRHRAVALLWFDSLESASRAVLDLLPHEPAACDLLDRRHLGLARETDVRYDLLVPRETEAALLVECSGSRVSEVRQRLQRMVDQVCRQRPLAFGSRQAFDPTEVELFWNLALKTPAALYRMKGANRPVPVIEDIVVAPEVLPDFLVRSQNVLKRHQTTASLFCHAGHGQLHLQPFLDLSDPENVTRMRRLAEDLYAEVFAVGGTLGGEHASGLSRTAFIAQQYGPLYEVFGEIKRIFDPAGILNPGKIVGTEPDLLVRDLRPPITTTPPAPASGASGKDAGLRNLVELQLNWQPDQVAPAIRTCNGCGECRSQAHHRRMCPMFRILPAEEASPRAKVNLIRGVLSGQLDLGALTSEEFKAIADLCINCHMCVQECPAQVDIPKLMAEAKGAYVAANGLRLSDWLLMRTDLIGTVGGRFAPLVNWAIGNPQMRWLLEKTLDIAQGRKLPRVDARSFLRRAARKRLTKPTRRTGHKVAYFVDAYANHYDTQLGRALVAILEHNSVAVYVPPDQRQAGMAAISSGALDYARKLARHNVTVLADAVRQGYHIVASEPAAALCLIREYPSLLDDDEARLVAAHTSEACDYLWRLHTSGRLQLDLRPVNATLGYHLPCRLKALHATSPGENLLRLIPGLTVYHLEEGCSGMAGTFGLKHANYRNSLRIGRGLINRLRDPVLQAGTTECSTCKMQMEQGTTKPTLHPLKLFALAYGLMPEVAALLTRPSEELRVT